jgi:hypothetical protein
MNGKIKIVLKRYSVDSFAKGDDHYSIEIYF